jgi:nucleoside-diphosphate-sugar epimerase
MATLITGVGLVGTSFAKLAAERGERIVFVDSEPRADYLSEKLPGVDVTSLRRDVRDLPALVEAMTAHHVDTVVHTAGLIGGRVADPLYTGLQINIGGTINVCEAVRLAGVKRLVHVSTFGVYDRTKEGDDPITEAFPLGGTNPYSASKVANELMVNTYANLYGFELLILRPANVFGVGHFWAGSGGGAAVQALIEAGLRGETLRTSPSRDFEYVYAKDVGRAIDLAATVSAPAQRAFNVGSGAVTTFAELVEAAKTALPGLNVERVEGGGSPTPGIKQPMDLSASKDHLGWEPQYDLVSGFEDYAKELRASLGL